MSGSASKSYGIHVAKLAGIPQKLLQRAGEKLKELEQSSSRDDLSSRENDDVQLSIFTDNFVYDPFQGDFGLSGPAGAEPAKGAL